MIEDVKYIRVGLIITQGYENKYWIALYNNHGLDLSGFLGRIGKNSKIFMAYNGETYIGDPLPNYKCILNSRREAIMNIRKVFPKIRKIKESQPWSGYGWDLFEIS